MEKFCLVMIVVLAASCGSNPGGPGIVDEDYFPHQTAFSWSYDRLGSVDTLGGEYLISGRRLASVTGLVEQGGAEIVEITSAGYDTLYAAGLDSIFLPLGGPALFRIDGSGVWSFRDSIGMDSILVARFPLTEGDSWIAYPEPEIEAVLVSMDETVTVPDGTFEDVLHISMSGDSLLIEMTTDLWFAPGVGLVRHSTDMVAGGMVTFYEMVEELTGHVTY